LISTGWSLSGDVDALLDDLRLDGAVEIETPPHRTRGCEDVVDSTEIHDLRE
jgi:hypothetical protein